MSKNRTVMDNLPTLAREMDFITEYLNKLPENHKFTVQMLDDLDDVRRSAFRLRDMVEVVFEELEGR